MNEGEGEGESDLKATETRRRVHCWPPPTPSQWGGPDRPPTAAASSTPSDVKKKLAVAGQCQEAAPSSAEQMELSLRA